MEVPNGPSLAATVARHGPLPPRSVLALAAGLAEALSAAHAAGLIHPGLRPATVLLTAGGPKMTDPGVARAAYRGLAPHLGTPPGMADFTPPERAAGLDSGPASDMFGLGTVLLYAATGAWMSHFAWHLDQLPAELRPVIERCMAADPARRPTAAELRTELAGAYPEAATYVARQPPGIPAAGTPAPAPYGTQAPAPYGTQPPAPPFPAQAVGPRERAPRRAALTRRHAGLIAIAALALAVAAVGTVYVINPWWYPVQPPTGLTADQRGGNSISLGWSNPASGPHPDKYVIMRDGAVAATVPGNVNHFTDGGLSPATNYDFRVIAYRGSSSSQPSPELRAATLTPPLSQAVFNSSFVVTEKITSGGDSVSGDADGDTWHDTWTFFSDCALGPCVTQLSGTIDDEGEAFNAVLKADGGGRYTGTVPINDYYYCGNSQTNYSRSTMQITVKALAAKGNGAQWLAAKLGGGLSWEVEPNANGNCGGGTLEISIAG